MLELQFMWAWHEEGSGDDRDKEVPEVASAKTSHSCKTETKKLQELFHDDVKISKEKILKADPRLERCLQVPWSVKILCVVVMRQEGKHCSSHPW